MSERVLRTGLPVLRLLLLLVPVFGVVAPRFVSLLWLLGSIPLLPLLPAVPWRRLSLPFVVLASLLVPGVIRAHDIGLAAEHVLTLAGLVLATLLWLQALQRFRAEDLQASRWYLVGGMVLASGLVLVEYLFGTPFSIFVASLLDRPVQFIYVYDRGIVILCLLLWPLLQFLRAERGITLMALLVMFALLWPTSSQASVFAVAAGMLAYLAASLLPGRVTSFLFLLLSAGALLGAPWLPDLISAYIPMDSELLVSANGAPRLQIWQAAAGYIQVRPWLGYGIEGARTLTGLQEHSHPHNGVLQLWLEFGLTGILMAILGLTLLVRRLTVQSLHFGLLASWLCIFAVSYNIWQTWWLAMPFILLVVMRTADRSQAAAAASGV